MKLGLGLLAGLTLAIVSGEVAVLTSWQCDPTRVESDLGCYLGKGFTLLGLGAGGALIALFLGVAACGATRQTQRWAWFIGFLALTVLLVAAVALFLLNANAPSFGFTTQDDSLLLLAVALLPAALAILTVIYLIVVSVLERGQTVPVSP
ncbi:MAG TPA: hypothetical protein VGF38_15135 [Ktedonobacterales bacterium]|jgi:hypothetical protein